jgi:hypothetical protein
MSTYLWQGGRRPQRQHFDPFHLKTIKEIVLKRDQRCRLCGKSDDALVCHHITYERYGKEIPEDLTLLCRECHMNFHQGFSNFHDRENENNLFRNFPSREELNKQNKFSPIPEGTYKFKVISAKVNKSAHEKDYFRTDFEVVEGEFKGKRITKNFWISNYDGSGFDLKAAEMWHDFCESCNLKFGKGFCMEWLNDREFLGTVFSRKAKDGKIYSDINYFYKAVSEQF